MAIADAEIDYLLTAVNRFTKKQLDRADVIGAYSGVRPLYDDNAANPSAVTRDYVFDVDGTPPLLSVFGGKITTYRKLAEHAMEKLKPFFPAMGDSWTAEAALPGGDFPGADFESYLESFRLVNRWLPADVARHYVRLYGSRASTIIGGSTDLGEHFGGTLYRAEIDYLRKVEWAQTAADILERRTKHGLHLSPANRDRVAAYLSASA